MDEFAELAREHIDADREFWSGPIQQHYQAVSVERPRDVGDASHGRLSLEPFEIEAFFNAQENPDLESNTSCSSPHLKLLKIRGTLRQTDGFGSSKVPRFMYTVLTDQMKVYPEAFWLLKCEYSGFHHWVSQETDTYYVETSDFALLWTFDHATVCTRVVLFTRRVEETQMEKWLDTLLERYKKHVSSPLLLAYLTAIAIGCTHDQEILRKHMEDIRKVERSIGYAKDYYEIRQRMDISSLADSIKTVGNVLHHIARKNTHHRMVEDILAFMEKDAEARHDSPVGSRGATRNGSAGLFAGVPSTKARLRATQEFLVYLRERSERLHTILYALMTHEDASVNTELAESSRHIAEAAKRDSSSMKTVAIMTMAFLPGTFIAALFAVPSLNWDSNSVVQSNFWVYWAFTLPATALVFLIWLVLDNRTSIVQWPRSRYSGDRSGTIGSDKIRD
ncbi:hypothetical protein F5Y15DRAFT_415606 [Xylariaceae sp. FL0016]|nr:hypothetical protein F5Y15DRAFT_415606 [Xylariaceae sp. FL0016]